MTNGLVFERTVASNTYLGAGWPRTPCAAARQSPHHHSWPPSQTIIIIANWQLVPWMLRRRARYLYLSFLWRLAIKPLLSSFYFFIRHAALASLCLAAGRLICCRLRSTMLFTSSWYLILVWFVCLFKWGWKLDRCSFVLQTRQTTSLLEGVGSALRFR